MQLHMEARDDCDGTVAMQAIVDESDVAVGALEDAREDPGAVDFSTRDSGDDEQEHEAEEESDRPRGIRDPGQPSAAERAEHDLSHIPARPWCRHCIRGKAKDKPSLKIRGAYSENLIPRVRLDYCFLTENERDDVEQGRQDRPGDDRAAPQEEAIPERDEDEDEVAEIFGDFLATDNVEEEADTEPSSTTMTVLVMQESACRSVWAYAVQHKGSSETWVTDQIVEDLDTVGLRNDRIVIKSDQETSANDIAREIAKCRASVYGTGLENSAIGDSDSNGTIERAIQDVEGQTRTLRSALEERIAVKVRLSSSVVPWMVRHAACLITRCRVRPSGRTSFQLMKGRRSNAKLVEFGEVVHFKIPKTNLMPGKFEDQWDEGLWVGFDMRSCEPHRHQCWCIQGGYHQAQA